MARSANQPPKSAVKKATSKAVATKAAEALADPQAGERERSLAGSTLSQTEPETVETIETVQDAGVAARGHLRRVVSALDALIGESQGVYGLHKNGDMAPWPELTRGGQCEGWLLALNEARDFLGRD